MADPKLTKVNVQIGYSSDDGYRMDVGFQGGTKNGAPVAPGPALLDALEELARLCCLFGFEQEAREKFEGPAGRIREWRESRKVAP